MAVFDITTSVWSPRCVKLAILAHDGIVAGFSLALSYIFRNGVPEQDAVHDLLLYDPALFVTVAAAVFAAFGLHRAVWCHVSAGEIVRIVEAVTAAIPVYVLLMFLFGRLDDLPRSVPVITWSLLIVMLGASRLTWRLIHEEGHRRQTSPTSCPLLIAGSGDECSLLLRGIRSGAETPYRPVGIIDPSGRNIGRRIQGVPVLGRTSELSEIVTQLRRRGEKTSTIVFAENNVGQSLRGLVRQAQDLGLETVCMPSIVKFRAALRKGRLEFEPVPLGALTGREPVQLDEGAIQALIEGKKVLLTGAGGSIGSELVRLIVKSRPAQMILLDNCEYNLYAIDQELRERGVETAIACLADIRDYGRLRTILEHLRPDLVFHAAALKHVPMVEMNPVEGVLTNVIGSCNVADAANAVGARAMVQISTDKAVNPSSVMGATKRIAELYSQALDAANLSEMTYGRRTRFFTVRFGNVIGSSGSVLQLFQKQVSQGGPVTITHPEMRRYFMTIREAAELVLQASALEASSGERGIIFVLDMGEPVRIVDVARHVIRLAGREPGRDIEIQTIGTRPGEKLVEQLFEHYEERVQANAEGVLAARSKPIELAIMRKSIAELLQLCGRQDELGLRLALQSLVPGCALDIKESEAA